MLSIIVYMATHPLPTLTPRAHGESIIWQALVYMIRFAL